LTINSTDDTIVNSGSGFIYTFTGSTKSLPANVVFNVNIPSLAPLPTTPGKYVAEFSLIDSGGLKIWSTLIPFREV
jgi:hypothetical protein